MERFSTIHKTLIIVVSQRIKQEYINATPDHMTKRGKLKGEESPRSTMLNSLVMGE
jgi:hypothetical protein